jgi:hypothetical protein
LLGDRGDKFVSEGEEAGTMKQPFAGLLSAALVLAIPAQAKFIGTMFYEPQIMLGMCKDDIACGNAGFCTGYIIATWEQMAGANEVCLPSGIEYEQIVRVRRTLSPLDFKRAGFSVNVPENIVLRGAWRSV